MRRTEQVSILVKRLWQRSSSLKCHYWTLNCLERAKDEKKADQKGRRNFNTHKEEALVTSHVLGVSKPAQHWIGATCHICNAKELFDDFNYVEKPQQVMLGDDRSDWYRCC